ncbi:hypothetical protein O181_078305, partial [Austropuccinia psidii MF-1]|nr:hypothetical protein [Austropuccinia psidii MF-1]
MLQDLNLQIIRMKNDHASELDSLHASFSNLRPSSHAPSAPSVYDKFCANPQKFAVRISPLKDDGSSFDEWFCDISTQLSFVYEQNTLSDDPVSFLGSLPARDHCLIIYFLTTSLPCDFIPTLGIAAFPPDALAILRAIRSCFSPGNRFQKLSMVREWSDLIILSALDGHFPMAKKNFIKAPTQIGSTIIASGKENPSAAFVAQVLSNSITTIERNSRHPTPFINCFSEVTSFTASPTALRSLLAPPPSEPRRPPDHLLERFGTSCHHCGEGGHWKADCPRRCSSFTGARKMRTTTFLLTVVATMRIPVEGGVLMLTCVPFTTAISGTILSLGQLVKAGILPVFEGQNCFLYLCDVVIPTFFKHNVWWLHVKPKVNGLSVMKLNASSTINIQLLPFQWHRRLGHASDKVVKSFLAANVKNFDLKTWTPFFCKICAKAKSTHRHARNRCEIPVSLPLDLMVSDVLGPFPPNIDGYRYLI